MQRPHTLSLLLGALLVVPLLSRAADPVPLFVEDFNQGLAKGWSWIRAQPQDWCLRHGGLEIRNRPGNAQSVLNALVRSAPDRAAGRYAIEVTVHHHQVPTEQFEQAGITWYCNGEPVFKFVKERVDGTLMMIPGRRPMDAPSVRLRVIVSRDRFVAQYQPNGEGPFLEAATGELPPPGTDQVSLQGYHGPADREHWMRFDDFRILRLPD